MLRLQLHLSVPGSSPNYLESKICNKCVLVKPCKIIDQTGVVSTFFEVMIDSLHDSDVHQGTTNYTALLDVLPSSDRKVIRIG